MAKTATKALAIGDHVRLTSRAANQHSSATAGGVLAATYREPVDGLVLAVRDVKTGKLMGQTKGDTDNFVIELLIDNTFNPRVASSRNAPRTIERPTASPAWKRVRAALRDAAANEQFHTVSAPDFDTDGPFAKLLDGWRVIKVWSRDLESLEQDEE